MPIPGEHKTVQSAFAGVHWLLTMRGYGPGLLLLSVALAATLIGLAAMLSNFAKALKVEFD